MINPDTVMAHRYLYYVLAKPIISDQEYDRLEKQVSQKFDAENGVWVDLLPPEHPLNKPGSSDPKSYTAKQVRLAKKMLKEVY